MKDRLAEKIERGEEEGEGIAEETESESMAIAGEARGKFCVRVCEKKGSKQ